MDENINQPKTYYTLSETPWYFGAYLNQARHNLYVVLNDISEKIGGNTIEDDGQITQSSALAILDASKQQDPVKLEKVMEYLDENMHFLFGMHYKYSTEEEKNIKRKHREMGRRTEAMQNITPVPQKYFEILTSLIKLLTEARNHFMHYTNAPLKIEPAVCDMLNDAFDVNVRIVAHRFKLDDKDLLHLRRFKQAKNPRDKPVRNEDFKYKFINGGSIEHGFNISEFGLAFLTALFLPRGDAYIFAKRISGLKRDDTPQFKATVEVFCTSGIKLPKERMESDTSPEALFLDMCNELAKCPAELYDHLQVDKQQQFITAVNDEQQQLFDDGNLAADEIGQDAKMVRKNNRFVFFAQRYLDVTKALPTLRFAVDLGTYYYSIYQKNIAGNIETRRLTKHLFGYGRLEEFSKDNRPDEFKTLYKDVAVLDDTQTEPYIKETYPHYHTENNLIPLYLVKAQNKNYGAVWPVIAKIPAGAEKAYPYKIVKDKEPKPFAYLSALEMPDVLLYHLLTVNNGDAFALQKVITDHVKHIKEFFNALTEGKIAPVAKKQMHKPAGAEIKAKANAEYNSRFNALVTLLKVYKLKPAHIPEKVINYLLCIGSTDWKITASERLTAMIAHAEKMVDNIEQREERAKDTKPGKKSFRKIKVGRLASILAEDMMQMQPVATGTDGENIISSKANTTVYRLIQSRLAFYSEHKLTLRQIFKEANLLDAPNDHPFLYKLNIEGQEGIIGFYKAYFKEKIKFLKHCQGKKEYDKYQHFIKVPESQPQIKKLASAYLNSNRKNEHENYSPINLPRGLFFDAAVHWLQKNGTPAMQAFLLQNADNTNTIHLVNYYFNTMYNDDVQAFYNWPRAYKVFNAKKGNADEPVYLTLEARIKKANNEKTEINALKQKTLWGNDKLNLEKQVKYFAHFKQNEQYLRLVTVQDKLMFMGIQNMLQQHTGGIALQAATGGQVLPNTFLLQNVSPAASSGKNILNCTPANGLSLTINFYETNSEGVYVRQNKTPVIAGTATITDTHVKIKNAGNFKKLVRDRRLNNLCYYFLPAPNGTRQLNRMVLENELKMYEKLRPAVLEKIAAFERKIYNATADKTVFYKQDGTPWHLLYLQQFFTLHPNMQTNNLCSTLNSIRNGFSHNQFPLVNVQGYALPPAQWQTINSAYAPAASGSTKGYGIIDKVAAFAIENYQALIDKL